VPATLPGAPNASTVPPSTELVPEIYGLTVRQFDRTVDLGVIAEDDRVELIEGLLVNKKGKKRPHVQAGVRGSRLLSRVVPASRHVRKEDPIVTSDWGKPEPDLAIVRGQIEDYDERDVSAADVALVVEIPEVSLPIDRSDKARIYAACGIPAYWIVNLVDQQIEVHSDPGSGGYRSIQVFKPGQDVPVLVDGSEVGRIPATELLPTRA
jgi:Uma2 family endonuclease